MKLDQYIELSEKIMILYSEMSEHSQKFGQENNLFCLTGCGACCLNKDVFVSELEMLPLALEFYLKNYKNPDKLEQILEKAKNSQSCLFYQKISEDGLSGYCGEYQHRGIICRIFGYSKTKNKNGYQLSVCKKIEKNDNVKIEDAPEMKHYFELIQQLDFSLSQKLLPISIAFSNMLTKIITDMYYERDDLVV